MNRIRETTRLALVPQHNPGINRSVSLRDANLPDRASSIDGILQPPPSEAIKNSYSRLSNRLRESKHKTVKGKKIKVKTKRVNSSVENLSELFSELNLAERPEKGTTWLPLELLVLIGRFLAGHNKYQTLANLGTACKSLRREIIPILYETFIWDHDKARTRNGMTARTIVEYIGGIEEQQREHFQHTRYIITCDANEDRAALGLLFYSLFSRIIVRIRLRSGVLSGSMIRGYYLDGGCILNIMKPVSALTLAQLFAIPFHWKDTFLVQPITTLLYVGIEGQGQVIGLRSSHRPPLPLLKPHLELGVSISRSTPSPQLKSTMQHILHCIDPSFEAYSFWETPLHLEYQAIGTTRHLRFTLYGGSTDVFALCLDCVRAILSLPTPFHIAFIFPSPMLISSASLDERRYSTESELNDLVQLAAEFYRTLWPMTAFKKRQEEARSLVDREFFRMTLFSAKRSALTGILKSDERDPHSFWSVQHRWVRNGGGQQILPARKYTVRV